MQIKLNAQLKYGPDPSDTYEPGSVLSSSHFPQETFGQHPERMMVELVSSGVATFVPEEAPTPPPLPAKKKEETPSGGDKSSAGSGSRK